jgi:hypothetical protein
MLWVSRFLSFRPGVGVDHPKYRQELAALPLTTRDSLVNDLY